MSATPVPWNTQLLEQLDWHWSTFLRPRWEGLTDDEYFWEPVPDCWSVRRVGDRWRCDYADPEPSPPPFTTIAWRLAHLVVGVFGERNHSHFDGPPISYVDFAYAGSADEALQQLDDGYRHWIEGVRALGEEGLARECGPAEGPYATHPLSELVLHINREAVHHGAEVSVLRDLYLRTTPRP